MAQTKTLVDGHGIINEACKILPDDYKVGFLEALGELEDNNSHKFKNFPKTRLHRVRGIKQTVYRADTDKTSGWRIHLQHIDGILYLRDIIEGQKHDDVVKVIKQKKIRYKQENKEHNQTVNRMRLSAHRLPYLMNKFINCFKINRSFCIPDPDAETLHCNVSNITDKGLKGFAEALRLFPWCLLRL